MDAEPYDERKVMEIIVPRGRNTILAHLEHLRDHNEQEKVEAAGGKHIPVKRTFVSITGEVLEEEIL